MAQKKRSRVRSNIALGSMSAGMQLTKPGIKKKLHAVLKCDTYGTAEAVSTILRKVTSPEVDFKVIHLGVGPVSKSDLLMALTGSKLVICFQVGAMPKVDQWAKEHGVEVRTYEVIYKLIEDVKKILQSMVETEPEEKIYGKGEVIALFKTAKGIIVGCQIQEGVFTVGKSFRIIAAMGPVYTGRLESLHIEKSVVREAKKGQQVGIKLSDFKGAKVGDLIECYEPAGPRASGGWRPSGDIIHVRS